RRAASPLAIPGSRHPEQATHPRHFEPVAMPFDPGVSHRDSFAKYAAAFFTISRSSFVLANSRRNRAFSASNSDTGRRAGVAGGSPDTVPALLSRTPMVLVPCGIPIRLAAALPPIDRPSLTASALNSSVYCRFGTSAFLLIAFSVHQKINSNLMYVKQRQGHILDRCVLQRQIRIHALEPGV